MWCLAVKDTEIPGHDDCEVRLSLVSNLLDNDVFLLLRVSTILESFLNTTPGVEVFQWHIAVEKFGVNHLDRAFEANFASADLLMDGVAPRVH